MAIMIITSGPTHSGKTTFGTRLLSMLGPDSKLIHTDNDVFDEFIKKNFNNLRNDEDILARRSPENPDLRLILPRRVAEYALREGYSVIATAAHPKEVIRRSYIEIAKKHKRDIILLRFKLDKETAYQRIEAAKRNEEILDISPHGGHDFKALYEKQTSTVLDEPSEEEMAEYSKVIEITPESYEDRLNDVASLIRSGSN